MSSWQIIDIIQIRVTNTGVLKRALFVTNLFTVMSAVIKGVWVQNTESILELAAVPEQTTTSKQGVETAPTTDGTANMGRKVTT